MATEMIGVGGMSNELKQTYDRLLLERALPNLVHTQFGQKRNIPPRGGKSIEFRRMERITINTTALTEGTNPTETVATYSAVSCTISQYGMYSKVSDLLDMQAFDPVIADYAENYAEVAGDVVDRICRDVITGGTTIQYAGTRVTLGSATGVGSGDFLDSAEIREAVSTLKRNNAKPVVDGKYIMIIHPDVTRDLFADPNVVDAFKDAGDRGANNPLFTGILGDYMGVRFVETTNAKVQSSLGYAGADVYNCLIVGKNAYGVTELDAQQMRMIVKSKAEEGGPLEMYSTVGWKTAFTSCILNNDFMVNVKVNASQSLSA
jgi:N4-gp56 family major capsid protein